MNEKNSDRFAADPHADREAEKYENPVPSREFIMQLLADRGELMTFDQLVESLNLHTQEELEGLRRRLRAMERDGQVTRTRKLGYGLVKKMDLIPGRIIGHADGFGFMVPDDGSEDLFLSAKRMKGVLHGDRVLARVTGFDHRGRREAAVVEVIEHANNQVVGRFVYEHGISFVIASNTRISQDILIPAEGRASASSGQIVVAEIVEQPSWRAQPIGKIVEVLGDHMAPGMEIDIAIRSHDLPNDWPPAVREEMKAFTEEVPEAAKQGRVDLRELPLVTIDGEDSRDFDDAVYCDREGKNYRLIVAIADVSAYVNPDTALDKEAINRGNSVYFPGRVIPMLPEVLSNGLCSLNPKVDRLCLACEMIVSPSGQLLEYKFFEAVMRSHARLTYTEVAGILVDGNPHLHKTYQQLLSHLENLYELYKLLNKQRKKRGAIEFETTETKIQFGAEKKIDCIVPVVRNDAHKLIEECMILANVASARYLLEAEIPALYRIHAGPGDEKFRDLQTFLGELGLVFPARGEPEPRHYAKLIEQIHGRPDEHIITMVLLRSLSQAVYCPDNSGHFGLALDAYAHFTSPIRRYPDLLVHRAIKHVISTQPVSQYRYKHEEMEQLGEHCSMTERRADEATRDVMDWLKCEFLSDRVGEEFPGLVTSVTGFGVFVELADLYVEGLVHITALKNDYYHYDAATHRLTGERTGEVFSLQDPVKVKVARVDLDEKKIDFDLLEHTSQKGKRAGITASNIPDKSKKKTGKKSGKRGGKKTAKPAEQNKPAAKKAGKKKSGRRSGSKPKPGTKRKR